MNQSKRLATNGGPTRGVARASWLFLWASQKQPSEESPLDATRARRGYVLDDGLLRRISKRLGDRTALGSIVCDRRLCKNRRTR